MSVKSWNEELHHHHKLSDYERQIVLGTLLGTSSIVWPKKSKHPHLQMRQSKESNGLWLRCKAEYLKDQARQKPFAEDHDSYRWSSISHECWEEFYELAYVKSRKKVTMEWLNSLTGRGIMVWYVDKGYEKNNHAYLKTSRFGQSGTALIAKYFNEVGCECKVLIDNGLRKVEFTDRGSNEFFKLVAAHIPQYLR